MAIHRFSIRTALRFGYQTTRANFGFFASAIGMMIGLAALQNLASSDTMIKTHSFLAFAAVIVFGILQIELGIAFKKIALGFCDGATPQFQDLFSCFPLFWKYLRTSALYALIVIAGTFLLIVPGIVWGLSFQFFGYLVIEKNMSPRESLKESARITKDARLDLLLFQIALVGLNVAGVLALGIGLFLTIPMTMLATAAVYRELLGSAKDAVPLPPSGSEAELV